jgi:hypothetical protein
VASSRLKSSVQPSSGKHSQAILGPLLGVIQDMYLNDTHKTHKGRGYSQILLSLASVRASYLHHNHDARACSLTQQLYRGPGVVCLYAQVRSRIFRGGVHTLQCDRPFLRPTLSPQHERTGALAVGLRTKEDHAPCYRWRRFSLG